MQAKAKRVNCTLHKSFLFMQRFIFHISERTVFSYKKNNLGGSSALIVIYKTGLTSRMMQRIAATTHHPATVFLNKADTNKPMCQIRWFNQLNEIKRCGHGTLAAANYLLESQPYCPKVFISNSNERFLIKVKRTAAQLELLTINATTFTADKLLQSIINTPIKAAFKTAPKNGYTVILIDEEVNLKNLDVDINAIEQSQKNAVIIMQIKSANTQQSNVYFRYFAPQFGVNEDSATGSAVSVIAQVAFRLSGLKSGLLIQQSASGALLNYALNKSRVLVY
ncbi:MULTISPECIES: PhzF family phenazine biosynthesis protein [unclassified Pseudoalteromonas]|uniref:PhzF family phenazine biosynthesis protein n=1 Tax=unclassified Pseudoalteromonas TaxID=194690 RepID=UPI001E497246|nr:MULTISPECIES: PhzF family phenazine biosynthesis protein [unclassified Pseudoalteromonas]